MNTTLVKSPIPKEIPKTPTSPTSTPVESTPSMKKIESNTKSFTSKRKYHSKDQGTRD